MHFTYQMFKVAYKLRRLETVRGDWCLAKQLPSSPFGSCVHIKILQLTSQIKTKHERYNIINKVMIWQFSWKLFFTKISKNS